MKTSNLYETLGVAREADAKAIKRAYRDKVKDHHPDKGGNPETFRAIQQAYDILSDPEKRKRYDETGEVETGAVPIWEAMLTSILEECIVRADKGDDIIEAAKRYIREGQIECDRKTREAKKDVDTLSKLLPQIEGPEKNLAAILIQGKINMAEGAIASLARSKEVGVRMLEELDKYKHVQPKREPATSVDAFMRLGGRDPASERRRMYRDSFGF